MHTLASWVKETTATTGSGLTLTLGGAVSGFVAFSDYPNITDGTTVYYGIINGSNREEGVGTWHTGNLLDRTTPAATLVSGVPDNTSPSRITLSGTSQVMLSLSPTVFSDIFANPSAIGSTTPAAGTFTTLTANTDVIVAKTITTAGTTGAQTINKTAGRVNFAAGASSLVVTNSLVTANSLIFLQLYGTADVTMINVTYTATSGSFTILANAAATAETRVNFIVFN